MVLVATQVKRRRGTTAENDAFTGAEGEIVVDTERHELRVHDGVTQGGFKIGGDKANVALDNLTNAGKEVISHNAMPSNRSIDLTLPASGGMITAPADGYLYLAKTSSASGQRVKFTNASSANMAVSTWSSGVQNLEIIMPVSKNNVVAIYYNADGLTNQFRFIYANGAQ